jgi:hypothetical protein
MPMYDNCLGVLLCPILSILSGCLGSGGGSSPKRTDSIRCHVYATQCILHCYSSSLTSLYLGAHLGNHLACLMLYLGFPLRVDHVLHVGTLHVILDLTEGVGSLAGPKVPVLG